MNVEVHLKTMGIVGWEHAVERRRRPHTRWTGTHLQGLECVLYTLVSWSLASVRGSPAGHRNSLSSVLCLGCQPDCGTGVRAACVPRRS